MQKEEYTPKEKALMLYELLNPDDNGGKEVLKESNRKKKKE